TNTNAGTPYIFAHTINTSNRGNTSTPHAYARTGFLGNNSYISNSLWILDFEEMTWIFFKKNSYQYD
ncbi:MAG: hypothetical protein KAX30_03360, partial [Candidatus Atribacteria bacterium]|nr:hypothetical protein [Candidatus Atribacteria bacterium]